MKQSALTGAVAAMLMTVFAHTSAVAQDRPTVVAVNYALSYLAERLGGADVDVVFPVPEGVDPAFWRPGIADISQMQSASLILLNGAGYATWTSKASLPRSRSVVTSRDFDDRYIATETVTHSHGDGGEHSHTGTASFTWLDPRQAILQAKVIAGAFDQRGFLPADDVTARFEALSEDLEAIDDAAQLLQTLAAGKSLIATHPRYQYFARAYGLDIRSLEWEAGAAPDADQLADLNALAEQTGASVLLWEAEPPPDAREAVRDLGLADVVFPTLATRPDGADYMQVFSQAVSDLADALNTSGG